LSDPAINTDMRSSANTSRLPALKELVGDDDALREQ